MPLSNTEQTLAKRVRKIGETGPPKKMAGERDTVISERYTKRRGCPKSASVILSPAFGGVNSANLTE